MSNLQEHFHAVRFYQDAASLCGIVAQFIADGIPERQPAIVIATPAHRKGIVDELTKRELAPQEREKNGDLILLDACETLARFMVDGMPHPAQFVDTITPVIEKASRRGNGVRAYGEMVDVLWKAGETLAATRLEILWNGLARTQTFSLLCGYAMGNFYKHGAVDDICSHHTHVMSHSGQTAAVA